MTIQIDLLETSRDRVVDGVYVAVSIRQRADDVDEFGFSTARKKKTVSAMISQRNSSKLTYRLVHTR